MEIKAVTRYVASDGKEFANEADAVEHQAEIDFNNILDNSEFFYYGELRGVTDAATLKVFLSSNATAIKKLMGWE